MINPVLAVIILSLKDLDNDLLAAANNGINGFGKIHPQNKSYPIMLELGLIKENGFPVDNQLSEALSFEVNDRFEKGIFS